MNQEIEVSWAPLLEAVSANRDPRAKYYMPTCLFAVCSLLDKGSNPMSGLSAEAVVEEFYVLVNPVNPQKAKNGWMPLWHLMNSQAWVCKKEGIQTSREAFPNAEKKPKWKRQLLQAVDSIDLSGRYYQLWCSKDRRDELRSLLCAMLRADVDDETRQIGEHLEVRLDESKLTGRLSYDDPESVADAHWVENYATYRTHIRIERNARIASEVKRIQGFSCLACGFNFQSVYGPLGEGYIEAHHIVPVAEHKGHSKEVDLLKDFFVLCSNCHKMIHRLGPPWTRERLEELRTLLRSRAASD